MRLKTGRPTSFLAPISAIALFAPRALADCSSDAECAKGFSCEVVAISGCTAPACRADQACPAPEPCEPQEFRDCVPATDCESDADCADGMVCFENASTTCTGTAHPCSPDGECPPPTPEVCTTTTQHQCTPRYFLPCTTAADCGEGFTCEEQFVCTGAGSGAPGIEGAPEASDPPAPMREGDSVPSPEPVSTECPSTGTNACQIIVKECKNADDCPSGWLCEVLPVPDCAPPSGAPADTCPALPAQPGPGQCVPPHGYATAVGTGAVATDAAGAPALESPDESVPTPTPSAPASGEGLGSAIAELAPASPESSEHPAASSHCSVGTPGLGSPPHGLVFCLGLLGLARRRRARA